MEGFVCLSVIFYILGKNLEVDISRIKPKLASIKPRVWSLLPPQLEHFLLIF